MLPTQSVSDSHTALLKAWSCTVVARRDLQLHTARQLRHLADLCCISLIPGLSLPPDLLMQRIACWPKG